jgi:histidyl-tRNA synthetase
MKIEDSNPPRGTRDLLPSSVSKRDFVLGKIAEVYARFGYRKIETPCLENIWRLSSGEGGENEKLIFRVLRRGLDEQVSAGTSVSDLVDLGLRYDLTVPLARYVSNNRASLMFPFRSFQVGPVWRAERPQSGRFRQFTQCDIDCIGEDTVLAETELIEATTEALAAIGIRDMTVRLSDRRLLSVLAETSGIPPDQRSEFFIGLDKLDKIGWDGVRAEFISRGIDQASTDRARGLIEELSDVGSASVVEVITRILPGLPDTVVDDMVTTLSCLEPLASKNGVRFEFDPTLVRGMGYYTGQIFEIGIQGSSSSIAGGGRYDKLIGRSTGKDVSACGFSIGFERIIDLVSDAPSKEMLAILYEVDVSLQAVLSIASKFRAEGRTASVFARSGKLPAQLSRLEKDGFTSWVTVQGDTSLEKLPVERRFVRPIMKT